MRFKIPDLQFPVKSSLNVSVRKPLEEAALLELCPLKVNLLNIVPVMFIALHYINNISETVCLFKKRYDC